MQNQNRQLEHFQMNHDKYKLPIVIPAESIERPENIGSIFRLADAFGVSQIYLTGKSLRPPNRKIRKTSRSTEKYVDYLFAPDSINVCRKLKADGYILVGLEITSRSADIRRIDLSQYSKICLVIGSENQEISDETLTEKDLIGHIPMIGHNSSLNVANTYTIVLYEIFRVQAKHI